MFLARADEFGDRRIGSGGASNDNGDFGLLLLLLLLLRAAAAGRLRGSRQSTIAQRAFAFAFP